MAMDKYQTIADKLMESETKAVTKCEAEAAVYGFSIIIDEYDKCMCDEVNFCEALNSFRKYKLYLCTYCENLKFRINGWKAFSTYEGNIPNTEKQLKKEYCISTHDHPDLIFHKTYEGALKFANCNNLKFIAKVTTGNIDEELLMCEDYADYDLFTTDSLVRIGDCELIM